MTNWEDIREEYETSDLTFKQLSEKFGEKVPTIKSRKQREGWTKADASNPKKAVASLSQMRADASKVPEEDNIHLSEKQKLFCLYYLKTFNQTLSAIKAGYSKDRAHVTGSELVRNSKIAAEIRRLKGEIHKELLIDAQDIVNLQLKIAFADVTDYVKFGKVEETLIDEYTGESLRYKNGKIKKRTRNFIDFENWDEIDGTIVSEVSQGKDGIKVKLADRSKAIDFLTKYFEMIPDQYKQQILEMKAEELALRKLELDRQTGTPEKPDISKYIAALRGNIEDVFADEQDETED